MTTIDRLFKRTEGKHSGARVAAAALFTIAILGACGGGGDGGDVAAAGGSPGSGASTTVEIHNFDFQPDPIEIETGGSVEWTNQDDILHTITSGIGQKQGVPGVSENTDAKPDGMFDQKMDGVGATFSFTFKKAGTYHYFCSIHPGMRGTIDVR
ncbi:MAG: hypothetical protein QOH90_1192 [Actinomycetota bacterium]|nr:hypothetical protein [Actinomycetota bacterium]